MSDPFKTHGEKVKEPDYLQWDRPGTTVTGVLRGIREGAGRDGKITHYLDLYVGGGRTISCSSPTTLHQKIKGSIGRACRIEFTGQDSLGGGKTLKRFDVIVLPANFDLKGADIDWGVKAGDGTALNVVSGTDEEELPF